jgi:transcriptional repressor CTCF
MPRPTRSVRVKQENEIQSYINSFKEIEEPEEEPGTSGGSKKSQETIEALDEYDEYEQIIVKDDQAGVDDEEYKYVFIVQDEEEGGEEKTEELEEEIDQLEGETEEVYEFDEYEEETEEAVGKPRPTRPLDAKQKKSALNLAFECKFCPYSSSKRYLLARHMKSHSDDR